MVVFLSILIGISAGITLLILWASTPRTAPEDGTVRPPAILFSAWLVAGAMFGPLFFVLRVPGVFDLTIERLLFILVLLVLLGGAFSDRVNFRNTRSIELWMFIFCLIAAASMARYGFVSSDPDFYPNPWYVFITGYFFPFIVFVFAKHFLSAEPDRSLVFHAIFYFATYLVIISFFEFYKMRQYVYPQYINDPKFFLHLERARGPFLNAALNGLAIVFGFLSGVHLLFRKQGLGRAVHMSLLMLYFPAVFFTQTRSVYLAFIVALAGLTFYYHTDFPKWKLIVLPLALIFVLATANADRLFSQKRRAGGVMQIDEVIIRFQLIQRSINIFKDNPIFGIGLAKFLPTSARQYRGRGAIAESADEQTQHNHLLGLMVEIGIIGIGAYLVIYYLIFRRLVHLFHQLPEKGFSGKNFITIAALIWAVYLTNNLFVEPSYFIFINSVPFMIAGMADGIYNRISQ